MICRDVEARITAYLDGELDATTSSALRGHLRACGDCRGLAEDHARIAGALAKLHDDPAEPPSALWNGVMARLAEAEATDARRSRWSLASQSLWQRLRSHLLPATAVAAAVAVAAVWLATRSDRREPAHTASHAPTLAPAPTPAPTPPPTLAPAPAPVEDLVDVEVALAAEAERVDRLYAGTAAELLEAAAEERGTWPASRRRAYDAELARLRAVLDGAPRAMGSQFGDDELEIADAGERRERAWQKLIGFLQRAALGELLAEAR